jgi:hypothetical protein
MNAFFRALIALSLCGLLTACLTTSPEQLAKRNEERCVNRGYKPGTPDFQDCIVRVESEADQRKETNRRYEIEKPGGPGLPRGY